MPSLLIVIGSTRPGRVGLSVGEWFHARARAHAGFDTTVADLAELDLPLLNEPAHPRLRQYTREHTHAWSAMVDAADAVVLVTSEYNHSFPAPLKNALDYLSQEWRYKPLGFVSYGGVAAGARAVEALVPVVTALQLHPASAAVQIPFVMAKRDDAGALISDEPMELAAAAMLDELVTLEAGMRALRA